MRFSFLVALAALLLSGCVSQQRYAEQAARVDSLRTTTRTLKADLYALQDSILFYEAIDSGQYYRDRRALLDSLDRLHFLLDACRDPTPMPPPVVATLAIDDLFEPASATLTDAGRAKLDTVADTLKATSGTVRVEAYADDVPVSGRLQERYPSNWELSAARAAAAVRHWVDAHTVPPARFEVVSLGATRPVASNATATGRRTNRRLRVLVLPRRP
ncbi:MAG: OmpA family protein [Bacteroidetes bacterium]|jgi:chemotaxis protein MotB|nr:OmpA family protein [Bacteroidota bacterium]